MTFQHLEQDMANAIGFVMDRSVTPAKILGQGFLVSKTRFVCSAGKVFHYTEAPWALELHFPHPDIKMAVKSVTLHPDFDKPQARQDYLAQTGTPGENLPVMANDMALLVVDNQPADLMAEKVLELTRAMSIPFSSEGVEASGATQGHEYLQVINNLLAQGKQGLFTLYDVHNIPIARVLLGQNSIPLVYYRSPEMPPAYAFFELAIKTPAAGYAFQPNGDFPWPDMAPINAPADRLIWEAMRRSNEINQFFTQVGGREARYQRVVQQYDPNSSSEEIRWMVAKLWDALDGYLTVEKLAERTAADSFTCITAVRELVNRGVISQINRRTPFHCNGTVGPPLISHTDFEVHNWDNLQCFYLDPLSGKPCWVQGNYFGSASAVQPKNMLHTIPVPADISGGLICKDYKLIGLHNGPQALRGGVTAPPMKCQQFMWMGALLDVSSKKGRIQDPESGEDGLSSLKSKLVTEQQASSAPPDEDRIICPVCFSANHEYGACNNCGNIIEKPPEEPEAKTVKDKGLQAVKKMQKKTGLTNKQMIIAAGILAPLFLITLANMFKAPEAPPPSDVKLPGEIGKHEINEKARKLAVEVAGFKVNPLTDYWYEDTSEETKPFPSFGVYSERTNQKMIFAVQSDDNLLSNYKAFARKPPYTKDFTTNEYMENLENGSEVLGAGAFSWMVIKGVTAKGADAKVLLGVFPTVQPGKAILVIGQPYGTEGGVYDPSISVSIINQLAEERTLKANQEKQALLNGKGPAEEDDADDDQKPVASDKDIQDFLDGAKAIIKENLTLPEWAEEEMKKDKSERRKWKIKLTVGIDQDGNVKTLEKQPYTDEDLEKLSSALQKAVMASAPFKSVPNFKQPQLKFLVKLIGDKVKIESAPTSTAL